MPHYGRFDDSVIFDYKSLLWGIFSVRINKYVYEILSKLPCIGIITIYNTLTVKNHGSVKLKKTYWFSRTVANWADNFDM